MKIKDLILTCIFFLLAVPVVAGEDDIMITRDGNMVPVRIVRMSASEVTYVNLDQKKRGNLTVPADFVYMIMKEKGNNVFFDEEGNQTTSPAVEIDKKDNVMFLNSGKMVVVYDVSVGKNEVNYKLRDKKKEPFKTIPKSDLFMIRNADGTTTLYNDSYQERKKAQQKQAAAEKANARNRAIQERLANSTPKSTEVPAQPENAALVSSSQVPTAQVQQGSPTSGVSTANAIKNENYIDAINSVEPQYIGKDDGDDCDRLLCIMGIDNNSQIIGDNVDITPLVGRVSVSDNARGGIGKVISERVEGTLDFNDKVGYNMTNPAIAFAIRNKSNKTVYIDLGNTFITRGEEAMAFYVPTSSSSSTSGSSGGSVNLGSIAGALGIGGTVGQIANGVNVGGGKTSGTVNTTYSQRVVAIPPMSSKRLEPQPMFTKTGGTWVDGLYIEPAGGGWLADFSFKHKGQKDYLRNGETYDYQEENSPLKFTFYVTYSYSENFEQSSNARIGLYLRKIFGFPKPKGWNSGGRYGIMLDKNFSNYENSLYFAGYVAEGLARFTSTCFPRN